MNLTPRRILVTGATGFIGAVVCDHLRARGDVVVPYSFTQMIAGNGQDMPQGIEACVHLAARVHVMNDRSVEPLAEYRRVNTQGTLALAHRAAASGCRRFVFVSTIKVNGEETPAGRRFTADDQPAPVDAYGVSKQEAETGLRNIAAETGMNVVVIRPPLVYGPGVRANFLSMIKLVDSGIPLPLGAVDNRRSLVAVDNLSSFILTCLDHPLAANETFLVSDDEDVSTTVLLTHLAKTLHRPARLVPIPPLWLKAAASMIGKAGMAQRLLGSLSLDIGKSRTLLDWTPPLSVQQGLEQVARWYRQK